MDDNGVKVTQLELKYCERCGGLWLRCKGDWEVYCATCIPIMAEFPLSWRGREFGEADIAGRWENVLAVCTGGGTA